VNENILKSPDANPGQSALATPPRYLSKRDLAALVQMSVRWVDSICAAGCPHLKLGRRRVRFDLPEVQAWLTENYRTQRRGVAR